MCYLASRLPSSPESAARVPANTTMPATLRSGDIAANFVLVIAAIATAIRFYQLDAGLWVDEIMTYVNYANQPFGVLVSTYDSQNHHILYSLFTHASFLIFGEGAWSLRLPAVLFGVGSILALYVFAREFVARREAVLSAALLAFSYHHVWFSQNARGYTALLFFSLLSSWMLVRALREQRLSLWLWYAVFAALGVYVHMTMLFMVIGHFLIFLWQRLSSARCALADNCQRVPGRLLYGRPDYTYPVRTCATATAGWHIHGRRGNHH